MTPDTHRDPVDDTHLPADDGFHPPVWSYFSARSGKVVEIFLRLSVGGAFVFAGALKVAGPAAFVTAVENYHLVPRLLVHLVAVLLPWVEIVAGAAVLTGIWLRAAASLLSAMTLMFAAVIISALVRGLDISCGCFGTVGGKHVGLVNLAIDATLACLAIALATRAGVDRRR